jgi:ATP-binding protein involved in chromosome partitioning
LAVADERVRPQCGASMIRRSRPERAGPERAGPDRVLDEAGGAIDALVEPLTGRSLGELGLVDALEPGTPLVVRVALPSEHYPLAERLRQAVVEAARGAGAASVAVETRVLGAEEQMELAGRLRAIADPEPAREHASGVGVAPPSQRPNPFARPGSKTRVLGITSGKGGVGKSSVSVNLAVAMARLGKRVAILDADVYGFSVPAMLGLDLGPVPIGDLLVPSVAHGVRCISMGFFADDDQPVIWRGPMLHKAIEQFLVDTFWGDPDVLVVDMPPGTGDVALSMAQYMPKSEVYVVTTPQMAAQRVAQRSGLMAKALKLPIRGVIENMSWFTGDDGTRYELFGAGGGRRLADLLGVELLGQIPLQRSFREGGDEGRPVVVAEPESEAAQAIERLAERILELGPARVWRKELRVR